MSVSTRHAEWLSLVETSGPFLVPAVLNEVFPQGLEAIDSPSRKRLRSAYDEWAEALDNGDPDLEALHQEWVRLALQEFLEFEESVFSKYDAKDSSLTYKSSEVDATFAPDYLLKNGDKEKPLLLVSVFPPETDFEKVNLGDGWPVSLSERMTLLCRSAGVRLGLLTNGERWMLVNAPNESSTGHTSWYARLWFQEPITLQAFQTLLGVRRFFGPEDERLDALLDKSLEQQEEVTNTLGEQVRRAVEVLVQALDRADQDRNRELLKDISPAELYEAGLTVMMRSVFILCAEERGLLLLGDETYDQCYAISTMRSQLAADADRYGPEVLERRHDAWSRLLAVFRAVYGGIEHEALRMPALGGSLFDPDRFPFLEGRANDTSWKDTPARPLPIDNRTVLLLLSALQVLEQRGGALLLSYKALDVEQIGHVYEGLLEHTVKRLPDTTLGLEGTKKVWNPNITLNELEALNGNNTEKLIKFLHEGTGRSKTAIMNSLKKEVDDATFSRTVAACGGDHELAERIKPFTNLLRTDAWGDFIVYTADSYAVASGMDRRETGTHYTPKSLTEVIVEKTLEPVAYVGPAEGRPREEWQLKNPNKLLDLKVCDPAMGSGAFLVQVCRWLSRRLVEAWGIEEASDRFITVDGEVKDKSDGQEPMPSNLDERLLIAKRLIAEKCLYGVDINPLAVELAKMSIWLVTMSKGRPFGFLDHNLRSGDSLLGIHRLEQLTKLSMEPDKQEQLRIFGQDIEKAVSEAIEIRKRLRNMPIRDIRDIETMSILDSDARGKLRVPELIADTLIGIVLDSRGKSHQVEQALNELSTFASDYINDNIDIGNRMSNQAKRLLSVDGPDSQSVRDPLHWPLEFPEVFVRTAGGFDAVVSNPPFLGCKYISETLGDDYFKYLSYVCGQPLGRADLVAQFFRRVVQILSQNCYCGLIGTKSISQGDTKVVALEPILKSGYRIYNATSTFKWPGSASVSVSVVHLCCGHDSPSTLLDGIQVSRINSSLRAETDSEEVYSLKENSRLSFIGYMPLGEGFIISSNTAEELLAEDPCNADVVKRYITGKEFNTSPIQSGERWIVDFADMSLDEAKKYPAPLRLVAEHVKPYRMTVKRKANRERWWQFAEVRPGLRQAISGMKTVLVVPIVTKYISFDFVEASSCFSNKFCIIPTEFVSVFSVFQSAIHLEWVLCHHTTLGATLNYTPKYCFDTFVVPSDLFKSGDQKYTSLALIGKSYRALRGESMTKRCQGLTETYNQLHDEHCSFDDIMSLRELQMQMDCAVAETYGWSDVDLGHGFRQTAQGVRFAISELASSEVRSRLRELNHKVYREEKKKPEQIRKARTNITSTPDNSNRNDIDIFEDTGK